MHIWADSSNIEHAERGLVNPVSKANSLVGQELRILCILHMYIHNEDSASFDKQQWYTWFF